MATSVTLRLEVQYTRVFVARRIQEAPLRWPMAMLTITYEKRVFVVLYLPLSSDPRFRFALCLALASDQYVQLSV